MKHYLFIILFLCSVKYQHAHSECADTLQGVYLEPLTVAAKIYSSPLKTDTDGRISLDLRILDNMPKILGNADPFRFMQLLPGIQSNAEYQAGLHIQGCDNSHNVITIGDIPIYNVNHLLGFFSIFTPSHYSSLTLSKNAMSVSAPNYLGGQLTMNNEINMDTTKRVEVSLGLISSQGTIKTLVRDKTMIAMSLRMSYLNMLYSNWLKIDNSQLKYSFRDANTTISHRFNSKSKLIFDFYIGDDLGNLTDYNYQAAVKAKWGNKMVGCNYIYENNDKLKLKNSLYMTTYNNNLDIKMQDVKYTLRSSILDVGYKLNFNQSRWNIGADVIYHQIQPQTVGQEGSYNKLLPTEPKTQSIENSVYCEYRKGISNIGRLNVGLRGNLYVIGKEQFINIDPIIAYKGIFCNTDFSIGYSVKHQYLFQTGFSDIGLPTEFWMSCSEKFKPQSSQGIVATISKELFKREFKVSSEFYYKKLYNQYEYIGSVLDLVNSKSELSNSIITGDGNNYGFNVMLHKCRGNLTGWISYAYSKSIRNFSGNSSLSGMYPSNHDRPHEINAVLNHTVDSHWDLGGTFVFASGTPITVPSSLYLVNGNIMTEYGKHNSHRLKPYCRLDLSVNYKWESRTIKESGINLSLYNALGFANELFYRIKVKKDGSFAYVPVSFVVDMLPSVSFFCKF